MTGMIILGKKVLQGIYNLQKLFPRDPKKIVFLSRQESRPLDFVLLEKELKEMDPDIKTLFLCKTMKAGLISLISYALNVIGPQLHALATSKVAVLDSYSAPICMLNHRPLKNGSGGSLRVFQMWHAMGALKKFSKSIVGHKEGRSTDLAESMNMHENYDLVLASSPKSREAFQEAFGYEEDHFVIGALPKTDLLNNPEYLRKKKAEILEANPSLDGKLIVLYAPTLRIDDNQKNEEVIKAKELVAEVEKLNDSNNRNKSDGGYAIIVSPHPVKGEHLRSALGEYVLPKYSTFELLSICDYFVTDYSAVVFEAAAAAKPISIYAYDMDSFSEARDFYLDIKSDLPAVPRVTAKEIAKEIEDYETKDDDYKNSIMERVSEFSDRYVVCKENNTRAVAEIIIELMKE